jgi:hypothetical protein
MKNQARELSEGVDLLSDDELDAVSGGDQVAHLPQSIHMDWCAADAGGRTNYDSVHRPPRYASNAWARKTPALTRASRAVTTSVIVVDLPRSPCRERRFSETRGKSN